MQQKFVTVFPSCLSLGWHYYRLWREKSEQGRQIPPLVGLHVVEQDVNSLKEEGCSYLGKD